MNSNTLRTLSSWALIPLAGMAPLAALAATADICAEGQLCYGGEIVPSAGEGEGAPVAAGAIDQLGGPLGTVTSQSVRGQLEHVQTRLRALRTGNDSTQGKRPKRFGLYIASWGDHISQDAAADRSEFKVLDRALTVGADTRLDDDVVLGGAIGATRANTRFTGSASRQDSDGYSATVYGSWSPTPATYVSATLGQVSNHFDLQRDTGGGSVATASTRGTALGLSISGGYDHVSGPWTLSPFIRWDGVTTRIAAFDESGSPAAVSVDAQRMRANSWNLGTNAQYSIPVSWGVVLPYARVEWTRRTDSGSGSASARMLSDNSALLVPSGDDKGRSYGAWAVGTSTLMQNGVSAFVDFESGFGQQGYRIRRIAAAVRIEM